MPNLSGPRRRKYKPVYRKTDPLTNAYTQVPTKMWAYLSGGHSGRVLGAFVKGANKVEEKSVGIRRADQPAITNKEAIVWGILRGSDRVIRSCQETNAVWYYVDHGYFSRGHGNSNYRIVRQGYQHSIVVDVPPDRWYRYADSMCIKEWRKDGRVILVCPPSPYVINYFKVGNWLIDTMRSIKKYTDREIVVREKTASYSRPLEKDLENAWALVTYTSNSAVEAVCRGVPVFVDQKSAACPVGNTQLADIEHPRMPNREKWLYSLAYGQFHISELEDGTAWKMINGNSL